jgi:hypothetical protein
VVGGEAKPHRPSKIYETWQRRGAWLYSAWRDRKRKVKSQNAEGEWHKDKMVHESAIFDILMTTNASEGIGCQT